MNNIKFDIISRTENIINEFNIKHKNRLNFYSNTPLNKEEIDFIESFGFKITELVEIQSQLFTAYKITRL